MEIRRWSGLFGVPTMIVVFALLAFASTGLLIAVIAIVVLYLVIGAVVWWGKRRGD
jgi:hypothetical protein